MQARLHAVGLKVLDYPRMKAFYQDTLGFAVERADEDREDRKACFFAGATPFYLVYDAPREGDPPPAARIRTRVDFHVDDVQAAWQEISAKVEKVNGPPHPTRWGGVGFSFKDPEGTTIHILQGKR